MHSLGIVQWNSTRRDHPGNPGGVSGSGPVSCALGLCTYCFLPHHKQKTISFYTKKEVGDGDGAKIGNLKVVKYNPESFRKTLASMIIRDELPLKAVEGEGFKDYSRLLEPRFVIPSHITVWRDCMKFFMENKKLLKNHLKNERL